MLKDKLKAKTQLLLLDQVSTLQYGNENKNRTIVGYIYVKNAKTNGILFKSNGWI